MSRRLTAHAAASTWGWARWPLFGGIVGAAVWVGSFLHEDQPLLYGLTAAVGLVIAGALAAAYPRCPRCGQHLFAASPEGGRRLFRPRSRCGKCNLDLTRYSPADPRAKKE
jgi:ribosomal protein S27AE